MTLYNGAPLVGDPVSLVAPRPSLARTTAKADLPDHSRAWLARSDEDQSCLYFEIRAAGRSVGQILLHDIEEQHRTAMVGYHIFRAGDRRQGFGSEALRLLVEYSRSSLGLRGLVAITSVENLASRRIAEKAGFVESGAAREGPHLVVYSRTLPA
jgi:RimJ/RimL family protein N-acetyltransferase